MTNAMPPCFMKNDGCPFCHRASSDVLCEVDYRDTSDAHAALPNIHGRIFECNSCGIAYASHQYDITVFPQLYEKTFEDMHSFDATPLQTIRKMVLKAILRDRYRRWSFSTLLDLLSLHSLQPPRLMRQPRGLTILDVGCGFGEFLSIYRALGNRVIGTEVLPQLVDSLQRRGFDCRSGEVETIDFDGNRFDAVIFRAVFYRTRQPGATLKRIKGLLAEGGEIVIIDPCPGRNGVEFFMRKQFPQGQFYIVDREKYLGMLRETFGLKCIRQRVTYGRPNVIQKRIRGMQVIIGFGELLLGNLFRYRPYTLTYTLTAIESRCDRVR